MNRLRRVLTVIILFIFIIGTVPVRALALSTYALGGTGGFSEQAGPSGGEDPADEGSAQESGTGEDTEEVYVTELQDPEVPGGEPPAGDSTDASGEEGAPGESPEPGSGQEGTEADTDEATAQVSWQGAPLLEAPTLGAAPSAKPVEVVVNYRLFNATAYNYAWAVTALAGIPTVDSVSVTLLEDGQPIDREGIEATKTESRNLNTDKRDYSWTIQWTLPAEDENGDPIEYGELSVATTPLLEDGTLPGYYCQSVSPYNYNTAIYKRFDIRTYLYGIDNVYLKPVWSGDGGDADPFGIRPDDIKITLLANGQPLRTADVVTRNISSQTVWKASTGTSDPGRAALPQLDENGGLIHYTLQVDNVPAYYSAALTQFPFVDGVGHQNSSGTNIYKGTTTTSPSPGQITARLDLELLSQSVTATFLFEGDGIGTEPELHNRPTTLVAQLEYTSDGGVTWQPFWGKYAYDVTEAGDVPNSFKYTWDKLPAVDAEGNPIQFRVRQQSLSLYTTGYDDPVISGDGSHTDLTVHNIYNDNWNYKVDLKWREDDPARRYDIDDVTVDTIERKLVYELNVSVQKPYKPGDMEIRLPYELIDTRTSDRGVVPYAISLGPANNPSPDFKYTYRIDDNGTPGDTGDDTLIFYNYRELESTDNVTISVQYNFYPQNVFDCSAQTFIAHATGAYTDTTGVRHDPEPIDSNPITYRIDTGQSGMKVTKTAGDPPNNKPANIYFWNSQWGDEPDDFDMTSYNYVQYKVYGICDKSNQPLYFVVNDTPGENGEVFRVFDTSYNPVEFSSDDDGYHWRSGVQRYSSYSVAYYVIVRYPRTSYPDPLHEGQTTYETDYTNRADITAYAADEHEGDKGPDDMNDIHSGEAQATDHWVDYEFNYTGDIYSTRKDMGSPNSFIDPIKFNTDMREGISWLEMTVNGYNLTDGYRLDLSDDAVYARATIDGVTTPYVRLQPGDYKLTGSGTGGPSVVVYLTEIDRTNGQEVFGTMPEAGPTFWGRKTFDGEWEPIGIRSTSVSETGKYIQYYLESFNDMDYVQFRLSLPEGMKDRCRVVVNNLGVTVRGTSPTIHAWLEQGETVTVHLENFAAFELYTGDGNGAYRWANPYETTSNTLSDAVGLDDEDLEQMGAYRHRKNSGWDLKIASQATTPRKVTVSKAQNPTDQTYSIQYRLSCTDEYRITSLPDEVFQAWAHESGVFFDLLPEGFTIDRTKEINVYGAHRISTGSNNGAVEKLTLSNGTNGQGKAVLESLEVIDNYKGTGRQMVIFRVKSIMPPGMNYGKNYQYTFTGFAVDFYVVGKYDDIPTGELFNFAAYQRTDGGLPYEGKTDEKCQGKPGYYFPPTPTGNDGKDIFYDINGDGRTDIPDTAYMYSSVTPDFLRTVENGIVKKVKATGPGFEDTDVADLGGEYVYRIKLTTSQGGITKNVVFYDVLENAANTGGSSTPESGWKGTFKTVDVSFAERAGIDVKVWYSTRDGLSYNDPDNLLLRSAPEGTWTDVCPDDPSTVKAVAFDLSINKDGTPRVFEENEVVYVDIIMTAPDSLQPQEFAYNRSAYDSTYMLKNSSVENPPTFNISYQRVTVSLKDLQDIVLIKTGPSFTDPDETVTLGGAYFNLYRCTNTAEDHVHSSGVSSSSSCWKLYSTMGTTSDGIVRFEDLDTGTYRIQEKTAPSGYTSYGSFYWWIFDVNASTGTVTDPEAFCSSGKTPVELQGDRENGYILKDDMEIAYVQITKKWSPTGVKLVNQPRVLHFRIYRQEGANAPKELYETFDMTITGSNNKSQKFTVPKYFDGVTPYIYTVEEDPVDGFTTSVSLSTGTSSNVTQYTFSVTNTLITEEVTVYKKWQNLDGTQTPPAGASATYRLYADGEPTTYVLKIDGVADTSVPTGAGAYEKEPWAAAFVNLPSYRYVKNQESGQYEAKKITYTVGEERGQTGYQADRESASDGDIITNVQQETQAEAAKIWQNADGTSTAPEGASVSFTLLADGEETSYTVVLDGTAEEAPASTGGYESEGWKVTFVHLPKYKTDGTKAVEIVYTVKETASWPGYSPGNDTVPDKGSVTNVQEETGCEASKKWQNIDGSGVPPEGATVSFSLLADGEPTGYEVILDGTADDTPLSSGGYEAEAWKAVFLHLPKYRVDDGSAVEIVYTVKETVKYPGYEPDSESVPDKGTITNIQQETEAYVNKSWHGADGTDDAPDGAQVCVYLLSDGEMTNWSVVLDGQAEEAPAGSGGYEQSPWKALFVHLPKYRIENGKAVEIVYSFEETEGYGGYEPVSAGAPNGGTILNFQAETSVTVQKQWKNSDGTKTPPVRAKVTFTLLINGEESEYTVVLDGEADDEPGVSGGYEAEAWQAVFVHLPKYALEDGETVEIEYTVKETKTFKGYSAEGTDTAGDGGTITNRENAGPPDTGFYTDNALWVVLLLVCTELLMFVVLKQLKLKKKI